MKELIKMIDKRGTINVSGWLVALVVTDVKKVFGTEKLFVEQLAFDFTPIPDSGQWINRGSFKAQEDK